MLCPIGRGSLSDKIHCVASGLYMADHHILTYLLGVQQRYSVGYYASLIGFGYALKQLQSAEQACGIGAEQNEPISEREAALAKLPIQTRRHVKMLELVVMVLEYSIFGTFVSGMTSGAPAL